jgi:hypothetical protein
VAIKLVTEVMDWAPPLTHREHKVLMILAENARLATRQTWDSVESPRILRRAQLTARQMHEVLTALVAKGCLNRSVAGGNNHRAKYTIARLAPPRSAEAAYEAWLARLSPGERQAVKYSGWWPDDDSQCAENPHTEPGSQCAGFTDTENPPATRDTPGSVCGKTPPRLRSTTGRGKAGLESADTQARPRVVAARRGSGGTTPSPDGVQASNSVALAREHNGSEPDGPDDQQIPIEVHPKSQATDRNAREATP